MMKKVFFLAFLLLFIPLVFAEEVTLDVGESTTVSGYEVLVKNVKSDKAVVSVNGESQIIDVGDTEEILGVNIKLIEVTYISDDEGIVKLDITSLFVCGNGSCSDQETQNSCCQDCGCSSGLVCEENKCVTQEANECNSDEDCNDQNENTWDRCTGSPKKCSNLLTLICESNEDCKDDNECTDDKCTNNDCFNTQIEGCVQQESKEQETEEVGQDQEIKEETTENAQEVIASEEVGFLSRIFGWLKRLFS